MHNLENGQLRRFESLIQKTITEQRELADNDKWLLIQGILLQHGYMSGVDRKSARVAATGEVFTPAWLVIKTMRAVNLASLAPGKNFLEPACGDGQIVVAALLTKILFHGMSAEKAAKEVYGVDIMRDNVDMCRTRMIKACKTLGLNLSLTTVKARILCGNFLTPSKKEEKQTAIELKLVKKILGGVSGNEVQGELL